MKLIKDIVQQIINTFGFELRRIDRSVKYPSNTTQSEREIIELAKPFTMVSMERLLNVIRTVQYLEAHQISGAIVECGVWRGGCIIAAIETLRRLGNTSRDVYLYDTFEGMTEPEACDQDVLGRKAVDLYRQHSSNGEGSSSWCHATLDEVRSALGRIDYPASRLHFIKGRVEDTVPGTMPDSIAMLRLDTDWYKATQHELTHLHPMVVPGGVLIVDDYGYWKGSRKAVDEYFNATKDVHYSHWIDASGRAYVRTAARL